MALNPCVREILCGLSGAVRTTLATIIEGYIAQLNAYRATLEAQLIYLDILTLPLQPLNALAQEALNQSKAGLNIVPLDLIGRCAGIGDLNNAISLNIDLAAASLNNITTDLNRLLSQSDEVRAVIAQVDTVISYYGEVLNEMDFCPEGS